MFNTIPNNPFPPSSASAGGGGGSYVLPVASADTLGGVKVGNGLSIDNGVLSSGGLQLYHDTYTGTGASFHVLNLLPNPVLVTYVGRVDGKVVLSPFSPKSLTARVDWTIPNVGNGTVSISEDDGVKIAGVDAGQACNTENIEYDVYYLA